MYGNILQPQNRVDVPGYLKVEKQSLSDSLSWIDYAYHLFYFLYGIHNKAGNKKLTFDAWQNTERKFHKLNWFILSGRNHLIT